MPSATELARPTLKMWRQLLDDAMFMNVDFTERHANTCYYYAKCETIEEVKNNEKFRNLPFLDFLEALTRCAEIKAVPTRAELVDAGVDSMVKFRKQYEDEGNNWDDWLAANAARPPRDPLVFRLQQVLHLFWHNLDKRGLAKGTT